MRRGLWPGCARHHCWLGPHHLLPKALLRYVQAPGRAGQAMGAMQWCMREHARITLAHGEDLSGPQVFGGKDCVGRLGASSPSRSQLPTQLVVGHRNGLSRRGVRWGV